MNRLFLSRARSLAAACGLLIGTAITHALTIDMVPVGDAGNPADPTTGSGAVNYAYNIGEYDVTAGQYAAFLNAVARTDPYGLYNPGMADFPKGCGIVQTGDPGNYAYGTTRDADLPVNYISRGDAARLCNWLSNGQPRGSEGNGTTETGSYTLDGATTDAALITITRNTAATYVIPTEDELYKAAYYSPTLNGGKGGYWLYSTQSNDPPDNTLSPLGSNNANFFDRGDFTDPVNFLTAVGAFSSSPGPYGTFDQGGDVYQWTEANISNLRREMRGGSFLISLPSMSSSGSADALFPTFEFFDVGFRVAEVPEPTSLGVLALGFLGLLTRRGRVR